ncbi:MAG TPA: J domain-containing protein [Blastocatellia bacterium]|jgi:DnaJ-class molecular chaperone|nr:J domain-containing protein [Blastocatellia bacterium]
MGVKFKDYYELLGVKRDATEDQIRQAYRKLARKHHPDLNPGDKQSEERFKEINEAYEVLSDGEKRKRYDQLGANWKNGADFNPPPGWGQVNVEYGDLSDVFGGGGFSDFFETLFGGGRTSARQTQRPRGRSRSQGKDTEAELSISLEDAHRGGIQRISIQGARPCPACEGKGTTGGVVCATCRGAGQVMSPRTLDVKIPPGARDGSVIKLARQGEPGQAGGEAGDLFVRLRIKPHALFSVSGDDLTVELPVAPWEAVLGASVEVPTIEAKSIEMKVPAAAQGGQRFRLRGQGLSKRGGGRGDQYVKLRIVVPGNISDREKRLYEELSEASRFNPRSVKE